MGFVEYLKVPEIAARYRKVRKYFFLRESAYDMTSACQLRCEGCYYFQGDKYAVRDQRDPEQWRAFFEGEKERGITYVVLAGAEPALVPKLLRTCYDVIPLGSIASNGLKPIDSEIRYRLHLSVWGDSAGDPKYRKLANGKPGPNCLPVQLKNYKDDERVVFVYTFNNENVDQLDEVVERVHDGGHQISFNIFSDPAVYNSPLKFRDTLKRTRAKMIQALEEYPETVIYSYYNAEVHTDDRSLHSLFGCPYPRAQLAQGTVPTGLSNSFRSYRTNLTHEPTSDCCVPDTDCSDCRHYAAGSAIVTSRLNLHVESEKQFRGWLDYVDTYLATWLIDYHRDANLYTPSEEMPSLIGSARGLGSPRESIAPGEGALAH